MAEPRPEPHSSEGPSWLCHELSCFPCFSKGAGKGIWSRGRSLLGSHLLI